VRDRLDRDCAGSWLAPGFGYDPSRLMTEATRFQVVRWHCRNHHASEIFP
jgi:hypothetical protein